MPKDKFMFFPNFKAMADKLDDGMRLKFYDALTNYVFHDIQPDDPIISALLEAIKPSLDKVDGRQNNGGNHNPNGVNQHTKVGQSGQIRSKLVNSGQSLSETETEVETEVETKEKEISDDISKKKFTADSEIDVNGQDFNEFPAECMPLLREYWTDEKIESIRKDLAAMYPHKTTVRRLLDKYEENKSEERRKNMSIKTYGENNKVRLTDEQYTKLQELYGRRLENAIQILDGYLAENKTRERKYTNHYAVMRRNNWVYNKTFDGDFVPLKPQVADMSKFVRAKPLGEEND
jgi:hypothetical protein